MTDEFLGGVIEGFYGRPWTHAQRLTMVEQLASWRLNTYFYAPKDDRKHRALWRECYDEAEIDSMRELVEACDRRKIRFIYGISPGLDIRFSDPSELTALRRRLEQMVRIGVRNFALLFDDLPGNMSAEDARRYPSVASAQAGVTNAIFAWLNEFDFDSRLLFCPTPYCDRMDRENLGGPDYLETIGQELDRAIDLFWTGPAIISEQIPVTSIDALSNRIGRKPVIWDNLHANDYDQRRLYCGPYSRDNELRNSVRGILSNPNNEFPINFIPLRTLGDYIHDPSYDPRTAYLRSAAEWSKRFGTIDSQISVDDVVLLADCHYLPFSDGDEALAIESCVTTMLELPVDQWGDSYDRFHRYRDRVVGLLEQLSELEDRELFYAWSRRIWDLREEMDLIADFTNAKRDGTLSVDGYASESHLPSIYRGGFVASLQKRLKMNQQGRFETS